MVGRSLLGLSARAERNCADPLASPALEEDARASREAGAPVSGMSVSQKCKQHKKSPMFGKKKVIHAIWGAISIIAVLSMVAYLLFPLFL